MNSAGYVSFGEATYMFDSIDLTELYNTRAIIPFAYDIYQAQEGKVFYRTTEDSPDLEQALSILTSVYGVNDPNHPSNSNFYPTMLFIVTWNSRHYFDPGNNIFQLVLITNEEVSYVLFLYKQIVYGEHATIGFHDMNGSNIVSLSYSQTARTLELPTLSNVGKPGVFVYRVDGKCFMITCIFLVHMHAIMTQMLKLF